MISVSNAFKTAAHAVGKTSIGKLVFTMDGVDTVLDATQVKEFSTESSACTSSTFSLGSVVSASLTASVLSSAIPQHLNGVRVAAYVGYVHDGIEDYMRDPVTSAEQPIGIFYVDDSCTQNAGLFTSFKAYDLFMSEGMDDFVDPEFIRAFSVEATPKENLDILAGIYDGYSWNYGSVPTTGITPVQVDASMTIREVIGRIAVACGCNTIINGKNEICFVYPKSVSAETIGLNSYTTCTIDGKDKTTVGYVQRTIMEEGGRGVEQYPDSAIVPDGVAGISFGENVLDGDDALRVVFERFAGVGGFTYQGHVATVTGYPYIEPMDCVTLVTVLNGVQTSNKVVPFTVKTTFNGAIRTEFESSTIKKANSTNKVISSAVSAATSKLSDSIAVLEARSASYYGISTSPSGSVEKTVDLPGFVIFQGATVAVKFEHDNASDYPTLNVNGTGAFPILANNIPLPSVSEYGWRAGQIVEFVYDGTSWCIVGANLANYCSFADVNGKRVLTVSQDASQRGFHTDIGADYMSLGHGDTASMMITPASIKIGAVAGKQVVVDNNGVTVSGGAAQAKFTSTELSLSVGSGSANTCIIRPSKMEVPVVEHVQAIFGRPNDEVVGLKYVFERRSNAHFSLKVVRG